MTIAIEDYAMIGDCETAALVHRNGSIDWLCWPRFDSQSCFAALLGAAEHGRWTICPDAPLGRTSRRYRDDTLVLETDFETSEGMCRIIDFMPVRSSASNLVRIVVGIRGRVRLQSSLCLRFDYGQLIPWIKRLDDGAIQAVSGPHSVHLQTPAQAQISDGRVLTSFEVEAGDHLPFVLTYQESHLPDPPPIDAFEALERTGRWWNDWVGHCGYDGRWREAVVRSLITIKALTYRPTGGIVGAPTTSLPEHIGGDRNWDYRYCWLRDATMTLQTLLRAGYTEEAIAWRDWLLRAAAGMPDRLQPLYGIDGRHRLEERFVEWLPGFCDSRPVRIGNRAHRQLQLDAFGQVLDAMYLSRQSGLPPEEASWELQAAIVEHLEGRWRDPDRGFWEVRGGDEHFTHSKILAWVAFDRAIRTAEHLGHPCPVQRWRRIRAEIKETVFRRGYDDQRGAFVRTLDGSEMDANLLLAPGVGFIDPNDPRMIGTVRAIEQDLLRDGYILRYDTRKVKDGLNPGEGAFVACTFWYIDNLVWQGRLPEAERTFERMLSQSNDVGLFSEEIEPRTGAFLGNFPQALSHIALIDAAHNIARAQASHG